MNDRLSVGLTLLLATGILFPYPSPVRDAVTERLAIGFHWHFSWTYLVLAPFCSVADFLTVLSLREFLAFMGYVITAILLSPFRWRSKAIIFAGLLSFLAWGILIPRPMARLESDDPDLLLIDFHSHTAYSHDGRRNFSPQANSQWHYRQGFGASFITDHNVVGGAQTGEVLSRRTWPHPLYSSLEGEEVSLFNTHLGVLGNREVIRNTPYDSSPFGIPLFVRDMKRRNCLVVAHLPEYWREHWAKGNIDFLNWTVDGFEIVNSVPYCLDFPATLRRQIVAHCRQKNLFMTGVSDNHGWGYATAAWSAVRIPGWREMSAALLEKSIFQVLRVERFHAVQVLERPLYRSEGAWQLALSPFVNLEIGVRTMGVWNALSCIGWLWAFRRLRL